MWPFKCTHPANRLHVKKSHTVEDSEKYPGQYDIVTYHLYCTKCNEDINVEYAEPHWDKIDQAIKEEQLLSS